MKLNILQVRNMFYMKNDKFYRLKRKAKDSVIERVGEKSTLVEANQKKTTFISRTHKQKKNNREIEGNPCPGCHRTK